MTESRFDPRFYYYAPPWLTYGELWELVEDCTGAWRLFPPTIVIASEQDLRSGWRVSGSAEPLTGARLHQRLGEVALRPGGLVLVADVERRIPGEDGELHVMDVRHVPVTGRDPVDEATQVIGRTTEPVWVLKHGDGGWALCLANSARPLRFGPFVVNGGEAWRVDRSWARELLKDAPDETTGIVCGTNAALEQLTPFGLKRWAGPGKVADSRKEPGWTVVCTDADAERAVWVGCRRRPTCFRPPSMRSESPARIVISSCSSGVQPGGTRTWTAWPSPSRKLSRQSTGNAPEHSPTYRRRDSCRTPKAPPCSAEIRSSRHGAMSARPSRRSRPPWPG